MDYKSMIENETSARGKAAEGLGLFDSNIWFGKGREYPLAPEIGPEELPGICSKYFLNGGLISTWDSVNLSAQDCNETLIAVEPDLPENTWTVWTALPLLPREQDPLPGYGPPAGKMRGVRIFPKTHRYACKPWVLGDLCSWCSEYRVPLFIWHIEADWDGLYQIAGDFPDLTLIVESQWQKILYQNRTLYNLMARRPNVLLEISNFAGQDFLTGAVEHFGAGRFIFGSFLPMNDPFVPIGMLLDSEIGAEDKKSIAGGNLRRLIQGVKTA